MHVLTFRGLDEAAEHKDMLDAALERYFIRAHKILEENIRGGLNHLMSAF